MRYFEMLNIIYDNNIEISFRKSNLGGIRIDVRKTVGDKLISEQKELTKDEIAANKMYTNNNYIPEMIANVLNAEKQLILRQNQST